jgi:2-dehydropantoate 2-reductase
MPRSAEPILIVGTGALASLFAARLSAIGQDVLILGTWQAAIDAFNTDGVHLISEDGDDEHYSLRATSDPADCAGARFALVLVKSWQTERAAEQLTACLADDGLALSLQNGIGNREILTEALGAQRVALGSTTTGAALLGPAKVRPGGEGIVSLGNHPQLAPLVDLLSEADFSVEMQEDIDSLIWSKLVINAAINPLTALLNIPNGELLTRPSARKLSAELAREVAAVAAAKGIQLAFADPVQAAEDVALRTAANRSSMLQDVDRGAPTEIEAICGAVVRAGEKLGIPTPLNETMRLLIKARVNLISETERKSHVAALP